MFDTPAASESKPSMSSKPDSRPSGLFGAGALADEPADNRPEKGGDNLFDDSDDEPAPVKSRPS